MYVEVYYFSPLFTHCFVSSIFFFSLMSVFRRSVHIQYMKTFLILVYRFIIFHYVIYQDIFNQFPVNKHLDYFSPLLFIDDATMNNSTYKLFCIVLIVFLWILSSFLSWKLYQIC